MTLIADSGSTKTDWALLAPEGVVICRTQGLNPFHQDRAAILGVLRGELLPQLGGRTPQRIFFYGAGCNAQAAPRMVECLKELFPAATVEAESDLLGAARALCGHEAAIACILGTGSNSCVYDGERITRNVPPLGYILGDEGSGAVMGRRLLNALYKDETWADLRQLFEQETGLAYADVISRVYRQPMANRFLASLTTFIGRHKAEDSRLSALATDCLTDFFRQNVLRYAEHTRLEVRCVGSIAHHFKAELEQAARAASCRLGTVLQRPIDGLTAYHG